MKKVYLLLLLVSTVKFAFSQKADAGPDRVLCAARRITIGNNANDPNLCFSWKATPADPTLINSNSARPSVRPTQTTTYTLTVIGQDFSSSTSDEVVITIEQNTAFNVRNATAAAGAAPSMALGANDYGFTYPENVIVTITACSDGTNWRAILLTITGNYSMQTRLLPGVTEVTGTGAGGNTTRANFCDQVRDLNTLAHVRVNWYMLGAVVAHENVHATRFGPAITAVANQIEILLENLTVADTGQTQAEAIAAIEALADYRTALTRAQQLWLADILIRVANDHNPGGPTDIAERGVVTPMINGICNHARTQMWPVCAACPP